MVVPTATANYEVELRSGVLFSQQKSVTRASNISLLLAIVGLFAATGISNAMKRLVYDRSGMSFRSRSRPLVREYRALYGRDRNYWAYLFAWLVFSLGMVGFALLPK
jgi:hypothetical protein